VSTDSSEVLVPGPWRHRFVAANGARFHVAETGQGPLVLLLHGFPQFWWAWRHQLPALAHAGYRAVAMDLRGYGASDKPPRGYDTFTLVADVAGVVRALGDHEAVVVGQDWGGWLAWSMPALAPRVTRAVGALSAAHPTAWRAGIAHGRQRRASAALAGFQVPMRPERRLSRGDGVDRILHAWAGPGFPDPATARCYRRAMQVPFVAHTALEYYRWAVRSVWRSDGRRFADEVDRPVKVPVLQVQGALDPFLLPRTAADSVRWAAGPYRYEILPQVGHFLAEESPDEVTALLLDWLAGLPPGHPDGSR
jgi:pimeloyl-ACP methyl ester carboxylesterase